MRMGLTQIQTEPQTIEMALHGIQDRRARRVRLGMLPPRTTTINIVCNDSLAPVPIVRQNKPPTAFEELASPARLRVIIRATARQFGLRPEHLQCRRKDYEVVGPRRIAMYLHRKHTFVGWNPIAHFWQRDHTTAIHAYRVVQKDINNDDPWTVAHIEAIEQAIGANNVDGNGRGISGERAGEWGARACDSGATRDDKECRPEEGLSLEVAAVEMGAACL